MIEYANFTLKLVLAILLGGVIGFERQRRGVEAGPRTHMLVCAGAMLFTYIAISAYGVTDSVSRIVQGIITGIGFLGAGNIIISQEKIKGLTTAAGVWVVASIGIGIAYGYYLIVIITTFFISLVLEFNDDWVRVKKRKKIKN